MKPAYKTLLIFVATFALFTSSRAQPSNDAQDKSQIDACIQKFYRVLSYQNNKLHNVDSLPDLFETDGTLTAAFGRQPLLWTAPQFVAFIKNGAAQGATDRSETELFEKTDVFGNMAHRLSIYSLQLKVGVKPDEQRGINSIQLVKQNGTWLIHSLVWDREKDTLKIPAAYNAPNGGLPHPHK